MDREDESRLLRLFESARRGDDRALDALLERIRPELLRFLSGKLQSSPGTDALAEELTQEATMRIAGAISSCRASSLASFRSWAWTIARRVAIDWHRQRKDEIDRRVWDRLNSHEEQFLGHALHRPVTRTVHSDHDVVSRTLGRLLMEAQQELSEGTRTVIRYRLLYGATWAEAGATIGTTAGGAKRRWQRARVRLRQEILSHVEDLPSSIRADVLARLGNDSRES